MARVRANRAQLRLLILALLIGASGCGFAKRATHAWIREPGTTPRGPETEALLQLFDDIGMAADAPERHQTRAIGEARLHQRVHDILSLPGRWIWLTARAEQRLDEHASLDVKALVKLPLPYDRSQVLLTRQLSSPRVEARLGALMVSEPQGAEIDPIELEGALEDPHAGVRAEAARAVARLERVASGPALAARIERETDTLARRAQLRALWRLDQDRARPIVRRLALEDRSSLVRTAAVELLDSGDHERDIDLLLTMVVEEQDAMVLDRVCELLARRAGIDQPVPSALGRPLTTAERELLRAAIEGKQ